VGNTANPYGDKERHMIVQVRGLRASGRAACRGIVVAASVLLSGPTVLPAWADTGAGGTGKQRKADFNAAAPLAGWKVTGDVAADAARRRGGKGGALKVGPGGKAVLKLREADESGKIEVWVHDDGTTPEDVKAHRVGPR
jgi:hypothetical protein